MGFAVWFRFLVFGKMGETATSLFAAGNDPAEREAS